MSKAKPKREPVQRRSADLFSEQLAKVKEIFPEVLTEGKVDFEKLRQTLGDEIDDRPERYSFTWAGKRDAIRLLQVPSHGTLVPVPKESINFEETSNVFIEGENLEVLKLLYKSYFGRVKMIYIDPPYNTGNDFIYPDDFSDPIATYLRLTRQTDESGNLLTSNPETSGRYHSAWLSMIYPRLFVARQLLQEDGVIFVSIDDHEVHNLRLVMNEIFGEENFIAQLIWKGRQFTDSRALSGVSTDHEYIFLYARSREASLRGVERDESKFSNPDSDTRGPWMSRSILGLATKEQRPNLHYDIVDPKTGVRYFPAENTGWRYSKQRMQELIDAGCILFPSDPKGRPREKKFRSDLANEFTSFSSIIDDVFTAHGTAEIRDLFGFQAYDFPKPSELIRRLVEQGTGRDDIVLDFFAGSATTAHAVFKQNREDGGSRRFVLVQLPEPLPVPEKKLKTIADIGKERLRGVIEAMQKGQGKLRDTESKEDLGFKLFKLARSNYKPWDASEEKDAERYAKQMELHIEPLVRGWRPEDVIWEVAIKEGFSLASRVEKQANGKNGTIYLVTDPEKGQSFRICLDDKIKLASLKSLNLKKDDLFICRDAALDDEAAANLALQCRLKTI